MAANDALTLRHVSSASVHDNDASLMAYFLPFSVRLSGQYKPATISLKHPQFPSLVARRAADFDALAI